MCSASERVVEGEDVSLVDIVSEVGEDCFEGLGHCAEVYRDVFILVSKSTGRVED